MINKTRQQEGFLSCHIYFEKIRLNLFCIPYKLLKLHRDQQSPPPSPQSPPPSKDETWSVNYIIHFELDTYPHPLQLHHLPPSLHGVCDLGSYSFQG